MRNLEFLGSGQSHLLALAQSLHDTQQEVQSQLSVGILTSCLFEECLLSYPITNSLLLAVYPDTAVGHNSKTERRVLGSQERREAAPVLRLH